MAHSDGEAVGGGCGTDPKLCLAVTLAVTLVVTSCLAQ